MYIAVESDLVFMEAFYYFLFLLSLVIHVIWYKLHIFHDDTKAKLQLMYASYINMVYKEASVPLECTTWICFCLEISEKCFFGNV